MEWRDTMIYLTNICCAKTKQDGRNAEYSWSGLVDSSTFIINNGVHDISVSRAPFRHLHFIIVEQVMCALSNVHASNEGGWQLWWFNAW